MLRPLPPLHCLIQLVWALDMCQEQEMVRKSTCKVEVERAETYREERAPVCDCSWAASTLCFETRVRRRVKERERHKRVDVRRYFRRPCAHAAFAARTKGVMKAAEQSVRGKTM